MYPKTLITPKQAAKELCNINAEFVAIILKDFIDRYAQEPLIGDTSDETLRKVYRRDGKLEAMRDLQDLFFSK